MVIINAGMSFCDLFLFSLAQINSVAFSVTTIKDYMVPDAFAYMILFTQDWIAFLSLDPS